MVASGELQIVNFTMGDVNYGVPVEQVREVRDVQTVTPVPGAPRYIEGVTNLRGQIITVMNLRKRLNIESNDKGEKIIVVDMGKAAVGVVVDSVTEVSTLPDENIERHMQVTKKLQEYLIGVGKQGEKLTVILDLAKIIADSKDEMPEQENESGSAKMIAAT